jgi:hypothetical protein
VKSHDDVVNVNEHDQLIVDVDTWKSWNWR